ncbi:hypothetical protein HMPREF1153_0383 [Selenomonas sp. CM52]|nr:hypothetical protein HMPREF1153_0383 [Selenomonas sp. CM52]
MRYNRTCINISYRNDIQESSEFIRASTRNAGKIQAEEKT